MARSMAFKAPFNPMVQPRVSRLPPCCSAALRVPLRRAAWRIVSGGDRAGAFALVAANLYVVFFNASWGPVVWVMLGEMFPNRFRGSALAVSGLSMWLANFLITLSFPVLLQRIGLGGAYSLYAGFAFLSLFFVYSLVRETRGRELEEMEG